jgi:carbon monoxide dehydrogenase subunit G
MIVEGEFTFRAPRRSVWVLLQDPGVLVKAMPGAQKLVSTGDGTYEGTVRIGVGPVTAAQWTLSVALHDREEPQRYMMKVDTKGPLGFTRGSASVELEEAEQSTTMRYRADLQIGGKVAGIGQRLLDQVARQLTRRGLEALSREMELRLNLNVGPASASFAVGTGTIVEGEIVVVEVDGSGAAADATDDAAAANPESGDTPEPATASSPAASAAAASAADAEAEDGPAAHPVEPLEETASPDSPLPPGLDDRPAPVANLDSELPPGTI